ncbi:MAG: Ppx/GppA family phosphatase, partial [Acidimicrobiia bacterium]
IAELTDLSADDWATRTVAVESADRAAITSAIRELGLSSHENACYGRGLTCLLGLAPARFAVIDVGTNSVKFHIGGHHEDGTWSRVADRAEVTRLGEGLDESGEIQREPMERTAEAISGMVEEARRSGVLVIDAVGTAGLRMARNRDAVLSRFHERAGIGVDVISGEEESRLAYLAATSELAQSEGSAVVFDTGGGSTQFTFGRGGVVDERFSVDVGAVPYTERFGLDHAVTAQVVQEALAAISHGLSRIKGRQTPDELVAMGGAVTNLAAISHSLVEYDADVVQGTILGLDEIDRQIELFRSMDSESRRSIVGIQPDRSEVILAGACIVRTVMEELGCNELTVSDRGLRHGILRERLGLFRAAHPTA